MEKIRIKQMHLTNFKGFEEKTFDFNDSEKIILGGRNGYGKTTIFDALELLFTGKIARMKNYLDLHDKRTSLKQESLPLVYSSVSNDTVAVEALINIDGHELEIMRSAYVKNMKNPVDFSAFSGLKVKEKDGYRDLSPNEIDDLGLCAFISTYNFLNYLSQEEATSFLLNKESDRANSISELFDLSKFDVPLGKLAQLNKKLNEREGAVEREQKLVTEMHQKSVALQKGETNRVVYQKLCTTQQFWDVENPALSFQQYETLLGENGVMDSLAYFCQHKEDFISYKINAFITKWTKEENLSSLALFFKFKNKEHLFDLYQEFCEIEDLYKNLTMGSVSDTLQHISAKLCDILGKDVNRLIDEKKETYLSLYNATTLIQKQKTQLSQLRLSISSIIQNTPETIENNACPLCGHRYESIEQLLREIANETVKEKQSITDIQSMLKESFISLKKTIEANVIVPLREYFAGQQITEFNYRRYKRFNKQDLERAFDNLNNMFSINVDANRTEDDIKMTIAESLQKQKRTVPDNVNYEQLNATYTAYARYIDKDRRHVDSINAKKEYLILQYQKSGIVNAWKQRLDTLRLKKDKIATLKREVKKLKDALQQERSEYLDKLISDIRILFHIYSGRILQDCAFGCGLYIKTDNSMKRILFTAERDENREVDALYNMSSGQLVSLAISLILCLNKLYGKGSFLAIDDPVQTIDDLNLWGLIETLRHDFAEHFLLLSTHEDKYASLLAYKFQKIGAKEKLIDMAQV